MAKLVWDKETDRYYETGISNLAIYPIDDGEYPTGYAWSGVTAVTESPSGAEASAVYADNIKYLNLVSEEELGLTLEAIRYPEEFEECDGTAELVGGVKIGQQPRKAFGMAYKTKVGNSNGAEIGEILHVVWNCLAAPSEKAYSTVNESPENMTFSWTLTTTKLKVEGWEDTLKPISHLEVDSRYVDEDVWTALDTTLFGSTSEDATLPLPGELLDMIDEILNPVVT